MASANPISVRKKDPPTESSDRDKTLRFLHVGDPDHLELFSPLCLRRGQVMRALTRQLFSYLPTSSDHRTSSCFTPVPDVAVEIPTIANGGLSGDRKTYRLTLREGVLWDTPKPREVTAADFIRGFKRLPHQLRGHEEFLDYFTSTISGMKDYADEYASEFAHPPETAADFGQFYTSRQIGGLVAVDAKVLIIQLDQPANDFLHILAMGAASAAPEEYDHQLPSWDRTLRSVISNGPYRLSESPDEGDSIVLRRNPNWSQASDPLRSQEAECIRFGAKPAFHGTDQPCDLWDLDEAWQFTLVTWGKSARQGRQFPASFPGYTLNPYLVFNLRSPNAESAMGSLNLRQAIAFAVDKVAIREIFAPLHGVAVEPLHSAIAPMSVGHRDWNPYPTPQGRGNPDIARRLLVEAGYGDGLTLIAAVRDIPIHRATMNSVAKDLEAIGIKLRFDTYDPTEYYGRLLGDPDRATHGEWDISEAGWTPDWWGNNGRAITRPLFHSSIEVGTNNYGGYRNPGVDELMELALQEGCERRSSELWQEVDRRIMHDLPILPLLAFACKACAARSSPGWGTWQERD